MSIRDKFVKKDGNGRDGHTRKIKAVTRGGGGGGSWSRQFLRRFLNRYRGAFTRRTKPPHMALGIATTSFKIALSFIVILGFVAGGSLLGIANAYINTAPDLDIARLTDTNLSSYIYDGDGELITMYSGIENRSWASIDEIPEMLQNAFIATEDARFYSHPGVDIKRIVGAFVGNFTSGGSQGASTITQQLIKNRMLTPERSYKRKIQEAYLALVLEKNYEKPLILEAYLNDINLAQSNYGVKSAAKDYFGKELSELTIRECAMLAGITQNPSKYDPRRNFYVRNTPEVTNNRTDTVLSRMRDNGYISNEEYEAALAEPLNIRENATGSGMYEMPYFVEYGVYDVVTKMLQSRNLEDTTANRAKMDEELRTGGYHIYLTVDREVQKAMEETIYNWNRYPAMMNSADKVIKTMNADGSYTELVQPQISATTLDWRTGELRGIVGGRQEPTGKKQLNRAYMSSQPIGSSMKPLAVYGPAIDVMNYGAGSIVWNMQGPVDGWISDKGYPASDPPYAPVTFRRSIQNSLNISSARTLMELSGPDAINNSISYLEKMGVSLDNLNPTGAGLALGTSGMTTIEMAVAFGSIANKGTYITPIAFTQVKDSDGNVVLDAKAMQETRQVFKPGTAWLLIDMMKNVINSGTGTSGRIPGYTIAGKTGTNDNFRGVTFCGINAYYTSAIWVGHDNYKPLRYAYGGSTCAPIYKEYMTNILNTKELPNADIITDSPESLGLKKITVCGVSGKLPTDACSHDASGIGTVTDWFPVEFNPGTCDMHQDITVCKESGKVAGQYCPETETRSYVVIDPDSSYAKITNLGSVFKVYSIGNSGIATQACDVHTSDWNNQNLNRQAAVNNANSTISWCQSQMNSLGNRLTATQRSELNNLIASLQALINDSGSTADAINASNTALRNRATSIFNNAPQPTPTPSATPMPTPTPSPSPDPED